MTEPFPERMFARARELQGHGLNWLLANGIAWLEERVRQWPPAWGDDLRVLLYGDFQAPDSTLTYPSLGITVHPEKKDNTIIKGAMTVLEATVKVSEKSVPALLDAAGRINLLLGAYTLYEWGNGGCGWWSWVTHDTGGGVLTKLTHDGIERSTTAVLSLPAEVRRKVEVAMFWVREPRNLLLESYRPDVLRVYSSYWNAFECLVEAVNILRPRPTPSRPEKQAQIDDFVQQRGGRLTAADVQKCYQDLVNPGFVGKASHALEVCFGSDGDRYAEECFRLSPQEERLYDIRNAINHGDIDAENPNELLRVQAWCYRRIAFRPLTSIAVSGSSPSGTLRTIPWGTRTSFYGNGCCNRGCRAGQPTSCSAADDGRRGKRAGAPSAHRCQTLPNTYEASFCQEANYPL